jgi:glycosyltransferase involved in cell wall biosynthesis
MAPAAQRILWITERYPPDRGGMAASCERQVRGLRGRDLALDVLVLSGPSEQPGVRASARDGGSDYRVDLAPDPGGAAQLAWHTARREHLVRPYTRAVGFGAGRPGHLAVTLAAWLGVPSTVLVRGNDFDRDWFDSRRGHFVNQSLSRAGAIGAVSVEKVERIRALFPDREVRWTPNAVEAAGFELLPADREVRDEVRAELAAGGRRVIGIFGELKFKKRVPLLLGALRDAGLAERVGLLIVGRIDDQLRALLADGALAPRHRRMPFVEAERLPGLYAACDFVALPSLFEGMPNVLLEGMAAGAVPLVSDAGAMAQVVEHGRTGFVFAAEDRDAAAGCLSTALALADAELEEMGRRAGELVVEKFSPDRELDVLCELLEIGG